MAGYMAGMPLKLHSEMGRVITLPRGCSTLRRMRAGETGHCVIPLSNRLCLEGEGL